MTRHVRHAMMRIIARGEWIAILCCALTACAPYRPQPLNPERGLIAFEARRLDDPGLRRFIEQTAHRPGSPWPPSAWGLAELTLAADYYQPDLAVARAKLAAAEAAVVTAGARPNPSLGFTPGYDTTAEPGISPWTLGFTLDVPIETAGKRGDRIAEARHLANAARLEVASTAWQVRARVRSSLVQLQAAERAGDILTQQLAAQHQAVALLEERLKLGQASLTEVMVSRLAAGQSALQLQDARRELTQARIALAAALGVPESALAGIRFSFSALDSLPNPEQAAPSRFAALLDRTDVLAALADYEASEAALRLEVAKQYPDLHLAPGYSHGYVARDLENEITLGISLTLPILSRNQGPIAEAQARRQQAAATFNAVQTHAVAQFEQAFSGYRDSLAKLRAADALLEDARERERSIAALFAQGAANRLQLVQAQSELETNELARMQAFTEAQLALGELEDGMQRASGSIRADVGPDGTDGMGRIEQHP